MGKFIVVDIDNTICKTDGTDYEHSTPYPERIAKINELYNQGNTIVYHTGRRWAMAQLTSYQLREWGCKYHSLVLGKPPADILIDDRAIRLEDLFV